MMNKMLGGCLAAGTAAAPVVVVVTAGVVGVTLTGVVAALVLTAAPPPPQAESSTGRAKQATTTPRSGCRDFTDVLCVGGGVQLAAGQLAQGKLVAAGRHISGLRRIELA